MRNQIKFKNLEDSVGFFFQRQLDLIKAKTYDILYPELKARELFPLDNEGNAGISEIIYYTYEKTGKAQFLDGISKDLPRADVGGSQTKQPVKTYGASFGYNIQEINAAKHSNIPLAQQKANALRRASEELINTTAFFGTPTKDIKGFLDYSDANKIINCPSGFTKLSPDQIVAFINSLFITVWNETLMIEKPDTLVLDPEHYAYLSCTRLSEYSDTTILEFLIDKCMFIDSREDVVPCNEMIGNADKLAVPVANADVAAVYTKHPDKIQLSIPQELEFMPIQEVGLEYITPAYACTAGLEVYYPKAIQFASIPIESDDIRKAIETRTVAKKADTK